jgi:hypothetical protein
MFRIYLKGKMNITQDILLTGQIAAAFTAILTLGGLVIKFLVVKPIKFKTL